MSDKETLILECSCAGRCSFLVFDVWDWDDEPREWFGEFYVRPGAGYWRWRIKKAFEILVGRSIPADICVQESEIRKLRDFLNQRFGASISTANDDTAADFERGNL